MVAISLDRFARPALALAVGSLGLALLATPTGAASKSDRSDRPKCTITGTSGDDVLRGTPKADVICGGAGNDRIYGRGGDDILIGGPGNDRIYGGAGDDTLIGEAGHDLLDGGAGDDLVIGGPGNDRVVSGGGVDTVSDTVLKSSDWTSTIEFRFNFPAGTRIQFAYEGGNCTSDEYGTPITTSANPQVSFIKLFTGRGGRVWDSCNYETSWANYRMTFDTPDGKLRQVKFTAKQPGIGIHEVRIECAERTVSCENGTNKVVLSYAG